MRPFLLAGSSLLALFGAGATALADTPVTFINGSPDADLNGPAVSTGFVNDDVLVNPDGLFSAQLQSDGNFVVHYGASPSGPIDWASGHENSGQPPYGLSSYRSNNSKLFGTSNTSFFVNQQNQPTNSVFELEGANGYSGPSFLSLNDNGTLSIYPGSNGVATGPTQTTIATPAATNLKELGLTSVNYDFNKATIGPETPVAGAVVKKTNSSGRDQTSNVSLTLTHTDTETFSWSESNAVATKIEAKSKLGIPGLDSELTIGITDTTTITNGTSDAATDTTTFTIQDQLTVPTGYTYQDQIVAKQGMESVPYTFTGTALFDNGQTGIVTGTGVYSGVTTGDFEVETTCVSSNCAGVGAVFTPIPVPEPATWAMMLMGFAGLGFAGYRASRKAALAA